MIACLALAASASAAETLRGGDVVEGALEAKGERVYEIALQTGDAAHVEVTYLGLDVELDVRAPDGSTLRRVDDVRVRDPLEAFTWIARLPGTHTIVVRERSGRSGGQFQLRVDAGTPAGPAEELSMEAERAFAEAVVEISRVRAGLEGASRERAGEHYDRAAALWQRAGNARLQARALIAAGSAAWIRDGHESLARCEAALRIVQKLDDLPQEAGALICVAEAHYSLDLNDEAVEAALRALEVARAGGVPFRESEGLQDLGVFHNARLERELARTYYEEAIAFSREVGDEEVLGVGLSSLAALVDNEGDAQAAYDLLRESLEVHRAAGNVEAQVNALINMSSSLNQLGDFAQSLQVASDCLRLSRLTGSPLNEVYCFRHMTTIAIEQRDWPTAIDRAREALDVAQRAKAPREERFAFSGLSYAYFKAGRLTEALQAAASAVDVSRRGGSPPDVYALLNLCRLREADGELDEAIASCTDALTTIRSAGPLRFEPIARYLLARVERRRDRLDAARSHADRALELLEERRAQIRRTDWRTSFVESHRELDQFYVDLLIEIAVRARTSVNVAEAFDAAERARTRALRDVIMESRLPGRKGVDPRLLARERLLRRRIAREVETSLRRAPGPAGAAPTPGRLESLENELREAESEIRRLTPRYTELNDSPIMGIGQLTSALDTESVVLAFAVGEDRTAMWAATSDGLEMHILPGRARLQALVEAVYASQSRPRAQSSGAARELSGLILGPVRSRLRPRLLVIADGTLHYLPFGALPDPRGGNVLEHHEVVSLPSVSTVRWLRQPALARSPRRTLAVLADPVFDAADQRIADRSRPALSTSGQAGAARAARDFGGLEGLSRLLFTRREATRIAALVGAPSDASVSLDFDANLRTVREAALGDYRFVHFATHGYLNPRRPELSGLVLSLFDPRGRPQDGFLSAPDAFNLDLAADVVVLSGCRTALGKQVRGEGLVGLPQAFLYAGARSVVSSLWNVDDAATAALMERFYQGLLAPEPLRPAAALRAAQAYVRSRPQWRHPYYWAAFQLQGDWN